MGKLRCAVLDDYQRAALIAADWSSIAHEVEVRVVHHHLRDEQEVAGTIGDCQIVVVMRERTPFGRSLFERLPTLRLLVTTGMRNSAIDLAAAQEHGVTVCGTASHGAPPAEMTWALILGLARHLLEEGATMRTNGPWQSTVGADLAGRTLGVLGLGRIGTMVARVGRAFDMKVLAWSQNLTATQAAAAGAQLARSKEQLLEESDVVSVHLLLSERTRALIGAPELRRMKPTAYLINTARAAIVDQDAMIQALRENWIAGAGIDVFDEEPLPRDHPLRTVPNLLATPHLGYVTRLNYATFYQEAVENIDAFLGGEPVRVLAAPAVVPAFDQ